MKNIFNVSSDEAKRIRNLHLNESKNKKISSIINEQDATQDDAVNIRIDEPIGDDMVKTDISVMDKGIEKKK